MSPSPLTGGYQPPAPPRPQTSARRNAHSNTGDPTRILPEDPPLTPANPQTSLFPAWC
ncbi:MAG: hypothetical protein KTV68_09650 [Acidimicrobiia bacterium]|nr:hypothetical protein [Acidimicrobiia bacterium]MCY4434557.1 hypothetical protein [bacterium]